MSVDVSTNLDHLLWNNVETLTYESTRFSGPATALAPKVFAVPVAKRMSLQRRELLASGGGYTAKDRVFMVPDLFVPQGIEPKPGDTLVDAQQRRWTVLEEKHQDLGATWRLTCRDLVLTWDLHDTIQIERATFSEDAAGAKVKIFPPGGGETIYPNLLCRVVPETEEVMEQQGIRGSAARYRILVSVQLSNPQIDVAEDRINWFGVLLDIERYENARQIAELPYLIAVQKA